MTFEEAKKQICERKNMYDSIVNRIEDPYNTAKDFYKGEACGLSEAIDILAKVEPVGNPDKLTLTELAYELRKIFRFKYLAYGEMFYWGRSQNVLWISDQPLTLSVRDEGGEGCPCYIHEWDGEDVIETFSEEDLVFPLDLSEYKDADGNIDYSKCIVEVE